MPSTDPDKIYAKKFKINDMLNDLYSELIKNKPEDPSDFAYKYFEAKIPPKPKSAEVNVIAFDIESNGSRKPSIAGASSAGASSGGGTGPIQGETLFAKLFNPKNLLGDKTNLIGDKQQLDVSSARLSSADYPDSNFKGMQPFYQLNLLNQIQRKFVAKSKELTDEEVLEREKIQFYGKEGESSEEDSDENKQKIVTYKSQLKNRDLNDRHKQDLKNLILQERSKVADINQKEITREREKKRSKDLRIRGLEIEEEEQVNELSDEIVLPNKINRTSEIHSERAKQRKIPFRDLSIQNNSSPFHRQHLSSRTSSMAPQGAQYIICPLCNRIQNQLPASGPQAGMYDDSRHDVKALNAVSETERIDRDANTAIPPVQDKEKEANDMKLSIFELLTSKKSLKDSKNDTFDDENIESASQVSGPRPIAPFEASTNRSSSDKPTDKHYDGDILSWVMNNQKNGNPMPLEVPSLGLDSSNNKEGSRPTAYNMTASNIQSPPSSARKASSRTGSKTGSNTSKSSRVSNSSRPSDANNEMRWTMKNSSSDLSTLVNKDTNGKKK